MSLNRQGIAGQALQPTYQVPVVGRQAPFTVGEGVVAVAAGETFNLPSGDYWVTPGPYCSLQTKDGVLGLWRPVATFPNTPKLVHSDGVNVRVVNLSGCAVGAIVSNVGSGYTSTPTVTSSGASDTWRAIVGGAINSTITITTAGAGYNYPPLLFFDPPPSGGVIASAYCTLSAGAVNAVTVVDQGAGYTTAPTVYVVPDPRDTGPTTAAVLTVNATLAGSGSITAVLPTNHGAAQTSVPTLTISGGGGASGAATAIMAFAATGFTVGTAGVAYGTSKPFGVLTTGGICSVAAGSVVNPSIGTGLFIPRQANISGTSTGGGATTATGAVVNDAGLFQAVPNGLVIPGGDTVPTTQAVVTITVGGALDRVYIQPV